MRVVNRSGATWVLAQRDLVVTLTSRSFLRLLLRELPMQNISYTEEPLKFISVRDIQVAGNNPYLIDNLVPERSVVLLSAPSNAGKTAILVHLATCLVEQR